MRSINTKYLGLTGEQIALEKQKKKGYTLVFQNFRCRIGEIDLVMLLDTTLVFVEVKTRSSDFFGYPEEAVSKQKQEKLRKSAEYFLEETSILYKEVRFDIISIIQNHKVQQIQHFEDAFW